MKTKLNYTVRTTRAPGETRDSVIPVIVERLSPVELETVIENCIDRGLISPTHPSNSKSRGWIPKAAKAGFCVE